MLPTLSPSALSLKHRNRFYFRTAALLAVSYTHLTLPTIYSV